MTHAPVRTCAGCGARRAKHELLRFVARDGVLVAAGPSTAGRGAYTCRSRACFERAVARRAFARALRSPVEIDPELAGLYTDLNG